MSTRPRVVFFATPWFAVPSLEATQQLADIVAVVTRLPAPTGRGHVIHKSPVHTLAESLGIQVVAPKKLDREAIAILRGLHPDLAVLVAYGKILPPELLAIPTLGFINVHPSLLPKFRGPSPIAGALLRGEVKTGVTIIKLDEEMDHGPILAQRSIAIRDHEHRPLLEQRLAQLGGELLGEALLPCYHGRLQPAPQDHAAATFTKILHRDDAVIDWGQEAQAIENKIRALDPWPGTVTTFFGQPLKILDGRTNALHVPQEKPGTVVRHGHDLAVVCGKGELILTRLQRSSGKPLEAHDFARGTKDFVGSVLGADRCDVT